MSASETGCAQERRRRDRRRLGDRRRGGCRPKTRIWRGLHGLHLWLAAACFVAFALVFDATVVAHAFLGRTEALAGALLSVAFAVAGVRCVIEGVRP